MEYFDVITEDGEKTGETVSRKIAHSSNVWHNVVHIIVYKFVNDELHVLCHKRSNKKDLNPGMWDPRFGGHVKSGDSIEETAVSELFEEVGMSARYEDFTLGEVVNSPWENNYERVSNFYYEFNGDETKLVFNDGEVQAIQWYKESDLIELLGTEGWTGGRKFLKILDDLKQII